MVVLWTIILGGVLVAITAWILYCRKPRSNGKNKTQRRTCSLHVIRGCLHCAHLFAPGESFWTCTACEQWELCSACYKAMLQGPAERRHLHEMVEESLVGPLDSRSRELMENAECCAEALQCAFKGYAKLNCLGYRRKIIVQQSEEENESQFEQKYTWLSYDDVFTRIDHCSSALHELVPQACVQDLPDGRVRCALLFAESSVEWLLAYYTVLMSTKLAIVPLNSYLSLDAISRLLTVIGQDVSVVFCSVHLKRLLVLVFNRAGISVQCPFVTINDCEEAYAVTIAQNCSAQKSGCDDEEDDVKTVPFDELASDHSHGWKRFVKKVSVMRHIMFPLCRRVPDDVDVLLPTSGSTGSVPKLAIIKDSRLAQLCRAGNNDGGSYSGTTQTTILAYRTMHQSVDSICRGGSIGVFSGSLSRVKEDAHLLRPTMFGAMPSFWNSLYQQFLEEQRQCGCTESEMINKWHDRMIFGNRVKTLLTTGAPLSDTTSSWLRNTFGVPLLNGYGCTECGGIMSNGSTKDGVTVQLLDRPDIGYTTADKPYPRGEIVASSPAMISGYFKNDEANQGSFLTMSDGKTYFRTGDLGVMHGPGNITIVGRCNSVTKLAHGVYICAEGLETIYSTECSDMVSQIFIYGSTALSNVAAVVVSSLKGTDNPVDTLRRRFREVAAKTGLSPWEVPSPVFLENEPFSRDNGLISAAGKLHRPSLIKKYAPLFEHGATTEAESSHLLQASSADTPFQIEDLSIGFSEIISNVLGPFDNDSGITAEMNVFELGADSLKVAQLSMLLQARFGTPVPVSVIVKLPVLRDIHAYVFQGSSAAQNTLERRTQELADKLKHDVEQQWLEIRENEWSKISEGLSTKERHCVLLTGAVGFLGIHILEQLQQDSNKTIRVKCLVRKKSEQDSGMARLRNACRRFHVDLDESRVEVVEGDVSQERFGLTKDDYACLADDVSSIIHCAAVIISSAPYSRHFTSNVLGTQNILEFASCSRARLVHVSTMGIATGLSSTETAEHVASLSGYAQSKWVAENLVRRAQEHGLPCVVIRSPVLIPDKLWNICNESDATMLLVRGLKQLGAVTRGRHMPQEYRFMHVDDTARVISRFWAALVGSSPSIGACRAPCNLVGTSFTLDQFVEALTSSTPAQIEVLGDVDFVNRINSSVTGGEHPLALFKGALLSGFPVVDKASGSSMLDADSIRLLEAAGMKADDALFSVSMESLIESLKQA